MDEQERAREAAVQERLAYYKREIAKYEKRYGKRREASDRWYRRMVNRAHDLQKSRKPLP